MRARAGELTHMTGVDDPYELPQQPELAIDTSTLDVAAAVERVIEYLTRCGVLAR